MAVEMTPNGTYGATRSPGTLANSVLKRFDGLFVGLYRLLGGRGMRALGAPLLLLTTVGARSGKARVTPRWRGFRTEAIPGWWWPLPREQPGTRRTTATWPESQIKSGSRLDAAD